MNYSEMSDFEINKAVAIAQGYAEENCDYGWSGRPDVGVEWNSRTGYPSLSFDYCNSWADAGPIIEKEKIHLFCEEEIWDCRGYNASHSPVDFANSNPLRAAMIIFLMMQEGK